MILERQQCFHYFIDLPSLIQQFSEPRPNSFLANDRSLISITPHASTHASESRSLPRFLARHKAHRFLFPSTFPSRSPSPLFPSKSSLYRLTLPPSASASPFPFVSSQNPTSLSRSHHLGANLLHSPLTPLHFRSISSYSFARVDGRVQSIIVAGTKLE